VAAIAALGGVKRVPPGDVFASLNGIELEEPAEDDSEESLAESYRRFRHMLDSASIG